MEVDLADETAQQSHFNGALSLPDARTQLTKSGPDAAQLRRRKEAELAYGRGRKIPGMSFVSYPSYILTIYSKGNKRQKAKREHEIVGEQI